MSQDADAGDDNLDLSALEAAVANLGLDDEEEEAPPNRPAPGLDLTEAPRPPDAGSTGVSVFDAPDLPEGIEIPDFSGASMVGSAAQDSDPDPFDDDDAGSSSGVLAPPPTGAGMQEDPDDGDPYSSVTDALRDMGANEPEAAEEMVSLPAPDPIPEPTDAMIETYTAQGGRVKGPLKAVKGLFGR